MLDASKSFNRVHFGVFRIILLVIRHVQYGKDINNVFLHISNGVKQGGVISPRIFTIYIDRHLLRLNKWEIGYHIHGKYNTWEF